jgi:peptidoglycan/xylan/chitin deacetylase (PgdA/CDA1 family)
MYHDVVSPGAEEESGFPGGHSRIYKLHTELFSAHLDAVAASGASVCNDVRALTAASRPPAPFTFDDGGVSFLDPIAGMLEARGWRGHFFITTGRVGSPGFLTAAQVRELAGRGHIVGSHSVHHPTRMAELPAAHMSEEWTESRKALADLLGAAVDTASVPGGYDSRQVAVSAADAGFGHLFHSEPWRHAWTPRARCGFTDDLRSCPHRPPRWRAAWRRTMRESAPVSGPSGR